MSSTIAELVSLAKDRSAHSRKILLENITDLFLTDDGRLSEHERALMTDILSKLLHTVEIDLREKLADALVRSEADVPEVVRMLANDEIQVARPLLKHSKILRDEDLIEIVRMRTDEHRLAIALRDDVSESVADALVEYGGADVLEALLRNHDANLSRRAMEYLVAESRRIDQFQEPLVGRDDLPSDLAYRMYWWVSAALRKKIVSEFSVDPVMVDRVIRRATDQALTEREEAGGTYVKAQRLVRRLHETGELTVQFLTGALRQRRLPVFVAGLAELAAIDFRTAWRIFSDRGGESMAILAKAIGMERGQFTTIHLLLGEAREGEQAKSPAVLKRILELFDAVSADNARGALIYWQRDSVYQMAMDELEHV